MRAAREFGVRLVGQIGGERPLTRMLEARTEQGEHVAIVVASDNATDADRSRLIQAAEQMLAAKVAGSLRIRAISPGRDAWLTDLWTTGCASDLVALRWPFRRRLDFVRRVVKSLSELHAVGIVHGCLCPANVLLDDDLRPVLSEAGSVPVQSLVQRKLDSVGYAAFAAPEVLLGEAPDVRSDVWSAGRLLESLLSGDEATLVADCLRLCFAEVRTARWVSALRLDAALEQVAARLPSGDVATLPMPSASLAARGRVPSLPGGGERQPSLPLAPRARTPSLPGAGERQPSLPTAVERRASVVDSREANRQTSSRARYGIAIVGVTASLGLAAMLGPEAELARRALVALAVLIVAVLALLAAIQKWSGADSAPERPSRGPRARK
jgi:hypothetical protein